VKKLKAAIVGSGNIGTDLMIKILRHGVNLEIAAMVGIDPTSDGLTRAERLGVATTAGGVEGLLQLPVFRDIDIVFDATSAAAHVKNDAMLRRAKPGIRMVDLTPAAIGPYCIPVVNGDEHLDALNVNMVSCGGQATIPMVAAVSRVQPVEYGEIIATVASRSVGPGTRQNIDEFTRTTAGAVEKVGGAKRGKAIIIINPAEPPLIMRDTVHCLTATAPDERAINESVQRMIKEVQRYVPGYMLKNGPVFDGNRVSIYLEVEGLGDYLPRYAGNLDIMTAAALRTAEMLAPEIAAGAYRAGGAR